MYTIQKIGVIYFCPKPLRPPSSPARAKCPSLISYFYYQTMNNSLSMDLFVYLCWSEFTQVPPSSVTSLCNVLLLSLLQGGHSFLPDKFQEFSRSFWQFSRSFSPYKLRSFPMYKLSLASRHNEGMVTSNLLFIKNNTSYSY